MKSVSSVATMRPPTMTVARLRCTSLPTPVAMAAGNMPTVATVDVISTGLKRSAAPSSTPVLTALLKSRSFPCNSVSATTHRARANSALSWPTRTSTSWRMSRNGPTSSRMGE